LVATTRLDTELVGPQNHPGLWQLLGQLELAANRLLTEDRNNVASYSSAMTNLANGVAQGITLTGSIASRGMESPATREKSLRLQAKFREIESLQMNQ
jgi:hypothetical protein